MNLIHNKKHTKRITLKFIIFIFLISNSVQSQTTVDWGIDVFPITLGSHVTLNVKNKFLVGMEGELLLNYSNYILIGGPKFSRGNSIAGLVGDVNPIPQNSYVPFLGYAVFTRILNKTKFPIDIGYRRNYLANGEDGGFVDGIYTKLFWPTTFKEKNGKIRRRLSGGVRLTFGQIRERGTKEFMLETNFWARIYLNFTKKHT